jgi:hypothetical protein
MSESNRQCEEVEMSAWDDSQWTGYNAKVLNVFAGGGFAWVEVTYVDLGYVGWRRLLGDTVEDVSRVFDIATEAKGTGFLVALRATNASGPGGTAEITAIQSV